MGAVSTPPTRPPGGAAWPAPGSTPRARRCTIPSPSGSRWPSLPALPLLASLAVRSQLKLRYGVDCQIKWPDDLLLNGKKDRGHPVRERLLRLPAAGPGASCAASASIWPSPRATSTPPACPRHLAGPAGAEVDLHRPAWLAEGLTDFGFDHPDVRASRRDGFAPFPGGIQGRLRQHGPPGDLDLPDGGQGAGEAIDVDADGPAWSSAPTAAKSMFSPAKSRCTASTALYDPLPKGGSVSESV